MRRRFHVARRDWEGRRVCGWPRSVAAWTFSSGRRSPDCAECPRPGCRRSTAGAFCRGPPVPCGWGLMVRVITTGPWATTMCFRARARRQRFEPRNQRVARSGCVVAIGEIPASSARRGGHWRSTARGGCEGGVPGALSAVAGSGVAGRASPGGGRDSRVSLRIGVRVERGSCSGVRIGGSGWGEQRDGGCAREPGAFQTSAGS